MTRGTVKGSFCMNASPWHRLGFCVFLVLFLSNYNLQSCGLRMPLSSMGEIRNLLRYTVWNLLTFSRHLRPFSVTNITHVYRLHMLPNGSEYSINTMAGYVDGLYRLEFDNDHIELNNANTTYTYKVVFRANAPTYHSAVAPYDPKNGTYVYRNQTTYYNDIVMVLWMKIDRLSGTGNLSYVDLSNANFLYANPGTIGPESFTGRWFQDAMKEIATLRVFRFNDVRDVYAKMLDNQRYL
ncbi:uncharacterized protein LOC135397774 [Ornithodoros turicata]|uniref:uncharacterized protein LOC135397774 n=1 Tax=Ornithodoros turicata TaxID=34597 RepID=UPI003139AED1